LSIAARAAQVKLEPLYDLVHRRGSEASHSNAAALVPFYEMMMSVSADPQLPDEVVPLTMGLLIYQPLAFPIYLKIGRGEVAELEYLTADVNNAVANLTS